MQTPETKLIGTSYIGAKMNESMVNLTYFSESHRKYSEACQREVEEMMKHPLTAEQAMEQALRNKRASQEERLRRQKEEQGQ